MERESLQDRYNKTFLEEAEQRREKLLYTKLSVGRVTDKRVKHILELLYQLHQCYYLGLFNAAINIGGNLLEQSLLVLFEEILRKKGSVSLKTKNGYELIREGESFINIGLNTLMLNALDIGIIDEKRFPKAMKLKNIRNQSTHDMLPSFRIVDNYFVANLENAYGKEYSTIKINRYEVRDKVLARSKEELFAFYVLTRTRSLISHLFKDRVKIYPPKEFEEEKTEQVKSELPSKVKLFIISITKFFTKKK